MSSKAAVLYRENDYPSARHIYEELLKNKEDDESLKHNVASCLAAEGHYQDAVELFETIKVDSNELLYNKGLCYYKVTRYTEAIINFEQLLSRCNEDLKIKKGKDTGIQVEFIRTIVSLLVCALWVDDQQEEMEKILLKVEWLFGQDEWWKKSLAHALYSMDNRYPECSQLYEELLPVDKSLLEVDPIILANLCVSYVLTGRNKDAESLMKDVEAEEQEKSNSLASDLASPITQISNNALMSHLDCINLSIGTLYCVKYNYEFGLTRIFKSIEPIWCKLNAENWFLVKRCILSLLDCHCKQMIFVRDELFNQVIKFLVECEKHGTLVEPYKQVRILTNQEHMLDKATKQEIEKTIYGRNSITFEARYLRSIVLSIIHD